MSDYDGVSFQITPVRGVRAFDVDSLGRLRGVVHHHIWRPGENVAKCQVDPMTRALTKRLYGGLIHGLYAGTYTAVEVPAEKPEPPAEPPKHDMAKCACGFYGFLDGSADYHNPGRVEGVIEAYGDVHLGTRGFRATKARIIALCVPEPSGGHDPYQRLVTWMAEHESSMIIGPAAAVLSAFASVMTVVLVISGSWLFGPAAALAGITAALAFASWAAIDVRVYREHQQQSEIDVELIRRNYAGIPIYTSRKAMLRDFPPDEPEKPGPDDERFWTMAVPR
jgi:hypothetical protein